jgi:hypothetical protein
VNGRWTDPSAFRADPAAVPASRPTRRQTLALLAVLAVVAGTVAAVSYLVRPERARAFDLFHGSLFLSDQKAPVAVDLATGKPTLRLLGAEKQVGSASAQALGVIPLTDRTLLLNQTTGEFNMVDSGGFVVKNTGGGVPLAKRAGTTSAIGVPSDNGQAYIVRTGPTGGTDVYLVGQPTVEAAIAATTGVRPRASTSMPQHAATTDGAAAAADGDLWLLVDTAGGRRTIRQLQVPTDSSTGAALQPTDHGTVGVAAAIGTASDGSGNAVPAVCSADRIQLFPPGGSAKTVRFHAPAGVDTVLAATNAAGRSAFLLHGSAGWSVVSVNADGTGLRGPVRLAGVDPAAPLAAPAASNGSLYTIDRDSGAVLRVDYDGKAAAVRGAPTYPLTKVGGVSVEAGPYHDAYVLGRGPRIVINSPTHDDALMIFTDGSHAPRPIVKNSAVTVNSVAGAEALTKTTGNPRTGNTAIPGGAKPKAQPVAPINNKIDCQTVTQKPHVPRVVSAVPGSRTLALAWSYPVLDPQDCYPSTYLVSLELISQNAPQPPGPRRVQGQTGVMLTGLFPSTTYKVTVTAYIHGQGTPSLPVRITTGPEGPAAPTNLAVSADAAGHWIIKFDGCGTIQSGCVQAQSWTITPSFCDGRGLSNPPAAKTVTADPTSRHQPPLTYGGGDALLGRGLQFQVQGTGTQGQAGSPSARSGCVYSWSPPVPGALSLSASKQPLTLGGPATTTVTLDLGPDPVRDVGGVGAQVTFTLTGNGGTQRKGPVVFDGTGSSVAARFGNVEPGKTYTASATVRPQHGGAAFTIPSVEVTTRAGWPAITLTPTCARTGSVTCELSVQLNGITSAQAAGETFDFSGSLQCGSVGQPIEQDGFDPKDPIDAGPVSQLNQFFGDCSVSGQLSESASNPDPKLFGGTVKDVPAARVDLGAAARSGAGQSAFTVSWGQGSDVHIDYTGTADLTSLTQNWTESVLAPNGSDCADPDGSATPDTDVHVDPACVNANAGKGQWTVRISYQDSTDGKAEGPFSYQLPNAPPNFAFCTPSNFTASWSGNKPQPSVTLAKPDGALGGCANWAYTLSDPTGADCPISGASGAPPLTMSLQCGSAPSADDWTLHIAWTDPAGADQSADVKVGGTPPSK